MIGICCRYVPNRQVAEDLAQDAFIKAIENSGSFKGTGNFESWMRRIVVNVALHYLRDQKKEIYLDDWIDNHSLVQESPNDNTEENSIDKAYFTEIELLDTINSLPEHHRLVFNMYVIDKFTHAQIGEELGISPGTSKSHLARARKTLKKLLYQKSSEKSDNKKINRVLILLVFPPQLQFVDRLYQRSFVSFEIQPQKPNTLNSLSFNNASLPVFKPLITSFKYYLIGGILGGTISVIIYITLLQTEKININETKIANEKQEKNVLNRFELSKDTLLKIFDLKTATIQPDSIILNSNLKKTDSMKKINQITALLLIAPGIVLDSQCQVKYENISEHSIYYKNLALSEFDNLVNSTATIRRELIEEKNDEKFKTDVYTTNRLSIIKDGIEIEPDTNGQDILSRKNRGKDIENSFVYQSQKYGIDYCNLANESIGNLSKWEIDLFCCGNEDFYGSGSKASIQTLVYFNIKSNNREQLNKGTYTFTNEPVVNRKEMTFHGSITLGSNIQELKITGGEFNIDYFQEQIIINFILKVNQGKRLSGYYRGPYKSFVRKN